MQTINISSSLVINNSTCSSIFRFLHIENFVACTRTNAIFFHSQKVINFLKEPVSIYLAKDIKRERLSTTWNFFKYFYHFSFSP